MTRELSNWTGQSINKGQSLIAEVGLACETILTLKAGSSVLVQ